MSSTLLLERRWLALGATALLVLALLPMRGIPASAQSNTVAGEAGFAMGAQILWLSDAQLATDLDVIASTGVRYVRIDLDWGAIEPTRGSYRWANTDRVLTAALERGLEVVALPTYTPAWQRPAGTTDKHAPNDPAAFAAFVRSAAERYVPVGVTVWEIWNEPNIINFWQPAPDAEAYTELLKLASTALRSVAPEVTVLTAGLAPAVDNGTNISPYTFIDTMYRQGAKDSFDAVAIHPYSFPAMPMGGEPWNTFSNVPRIYNTMVANGDGNKLIWGTEFGAPTGSSAQAVSEQRQASIVTEAYTAWSAWPFTGPLLWYSNRDVGTNPADPEDNFGLFRRNGSPKLAVAAFREAIAQPSSAPTPPDPVPEPDPDPVPEPDPDPVPEPDPDPDPVPEPEPEPDPEPVEHWNFDRGTEGWHAGHTGGRVTHETTRTHQGAGSLRNRSWFGSLSTSTARFHSGVIGGDHRANGEVLGIWVYVPSDAGGVNWKARIELQDGTRGAITRGTLIDVIPGRWNHVSHDFGESLRDVHRVGVQVQGDVVGGFRNVYIDTFTQRPR